MSSSVSNLALQLQSVSNLLSEQSNLGTLNEQLASGVQHNNLTDYDPTAAHNLMNFQNAVTQKNAYLASMQTVQSRLSLYDQTMNDMEKLAASAASLTSSNQSLDPSKVGQLQAQAQAYISQVVDDLNQQIGGRYIYAGTRYTTPPVINNLVAVSGTPTWPFVPVTQADTPSNLPPYDSQYTASSIVNGAWTKDSVTVDTNFSIQYGVTSTDPSFQKLVAGLQFMLAATQTGVSATTYQTDMTQASTLLNTALTGIQSLHAGVANNQNILTNETTSQNTDITNLQNQLTNIQQVNITQVGTEINVLQSQLQASYAATASLEQLSILKYL